MAAATSQHPGIVALDQRIKSIKSVLALRTPEATNELERQIKQEIAELQDRLVMVQRHRESSATAATARKEELDGLEKLRTLCLANEHVAQLVWVKLLQEHNDLRRLAEARGK